VVVAEFCEVFFMTKGLGQLLNEVERNLCNILA
jgi:hypothetical protein